MPEFLVACTPAGDCLVAFAFVDRMSCINGAKGHYANLGNFRDVDGPPRRINDPTAFTDSRIAPTSASRRGPGNPYSSTGRPADVQVVSRGCR